LLADRKHAIEEAQKIGYPVMLKCTSGGGGIGMTICQSDSDLDKNFDKIQS
jgi:urea carboxylase